MSLAIKYESVEDAKMRLRGTVVLYKGTPVYITDVRKGDGDKDDILRVLFQELPVTSKVGGIFDPEGMRIGGLAKAEEEEAKRKYISSKHFDIAPFRLGYVNAPTGAFYCTRLPNRIQKQGLCAENFQGKDNFKNGVDFKTFLYCKETVAMIAGDYPSFDRALTLLPKVASIAFHRDFCLVKDEVVPDLTYLYHKGSKVGYFNKTEITLGKQFNCLRESLEEIRVKVGKAA